MEKFIIDDRIFNIKFSCDLLKCKGACCTLNGAGGAPILDEEVSKINSVIKVVKKYLSDKSKEVLDKEGFLEGRKEDYSIKSVEDQDCVFVYYENDIAKCSFEKAFNNGESDFKKPISCHLFPVRINGKNRNIIKYEEISECENALSKGHDENITIFEFVRDSIEREYGKNFYKELEIKYLRKN